MCEIDIGNPKTRHSRNWFKYETFFTFELKVIRHEERETQSFYADKLLVWPRRDPNVNLPVRTQELNSLLFLKPHNPQPKLPVRDITDIPWS